MKRNKLFQAIRFRISLGVATVLCLAAIGTQAQVITYHNDIARTGLNPLETILTPANVNPSTFGLIFTLPVDGQVYAQPLFLPNVPIPGKGVHNVVYIATEHDSMYAFDADSNTGANANPLWQVSFGASVPNGDVGTGDINPEIGITGTPVIMPISSTNPVPQLYVVSKVKTTDSNGNPVYTQQLHMLNAETGAERPNSPVTIQGSVPGVGDASVNGVVTFNPLIQNNRSALLLVPSTVKGVNGTIYVAYASHGDNGPYHGWVFEYDAVTLKLLAIVNTTPNALTDPSGYPLAAGGIWQGGAGPASDGTSVYFATGNGSFDPTVGSYGDSVVRILNRGKSILDYFTPSDQLNLDDYDADLGSGGVMLIPTPAGSSRLPSLLVQAGKEGTIYLLNRTNLGKYNPTDNVVQELPSVTGGVWGSPAYFNYTVYYGGSGSNLMAFPIKGAAFTSTSSTSQSPTAYGYPGPSPSISANGVRNGIVWAVETDGYGNGSPSILHAYDATNLVNELYNSSNTSGRDQLGPAVKFAVPTIANGRVYVGTAGQVNVFGLGKWAAAPVVTPKAGNYTTSVTVKVTDTTPGAAIYYTTDGSVPTTSSTLYKAPVKLTASSTFQAKAFAAGYGNSPVTAANYLINPVTGTGTGLLGNYYNNSQNPGGVPTASEIDPVIDFNWNGNSPIAGVAGTNWAGEWLGQIQGMVTGTYTISTYSDDGVQVYINGQLIINDYGYHGTTLDQGTITLQAGVKYSIDIKYFQGSGGSVLMLQWATNGLPTEFVPASQLYPAKN